MSGNNTPPSPAAPSVREAALNLLAVLDASWSDQTVDALIPSTDALRLALQHQPSRHGQLRDADLVAEAIELIRRSAPPGELRPEHIVAVTNAAEQALIDTDVEGLRWDADMRAIKRWQDAAPEGVDRSLVWPDHADLVVWLLELIEARPACPSIDAVASKISALRTIYPASPIVMEAADQLEQLANALMASSRRTLQAESDRQLIPRLIAAWARTVEAETIGRLLADGIEAGEWLPLRGAAIRAQREAAVMGEDGHVLGSVGSLSIRPDEQVSGCESVLVDPDAATGCADDHSPLGAAVGQMIEPATPTEPPVPEEVEDQRVRRYGAGYAPDGGGRPVHLGLIGDEEKGS